MENMKKKTITCPGVTFPIQRFLLPPPRFTASQPLAHRFTMRSQLKFLCWPSCRGRWERHLAWEAWRGNLAVWGIVDGSEIRREKQLSLVVEIPLCTMGFIHPNGGWPWDFWTINSSSLFFFWIWVGLFSLIWATKTPPTSYVPLNPGQLIGILIISYHMGSIIPYTLNNQG